MSIFLCAECDNLSDADDGCDALPGTNDLICADCMVELGCAWCNSLAVVTELDGDRLCQSCANEWVRGEGQAAYEREQAEQSQPDQMTGNGR